MAAKKLKIKPYNLGMVKNRGGFIMTISGTTSGNKVHKVEIDFEDWYIKYFVKDFVRIIAEKKNDLQSLQDRFNIEKATL